jgi:peptidoglycan/xylan/chitin deacetylase (PgdA/CDA1 family)
MKSWFWLFLLSYSAFAGIEEILQYPEDRVYTSSDRGFAKYLAKSIYHTNTFALTFDDGPNPATTPQVLDVLKKHDVKAVFFVLSEKVTDATFPLIKRMLDEGHIVADHGPDHINSNELTEEQWKNSMRVSLHTIAKMYQRAGHDFTSVYYRYPYGAYAGRSDYHHMNSLQSVSKELFGDNCIQFAFWDVDTVDWLPGMTSPEIAQNIIAWNEGGKAIDFIKKPNGTFAKKPYNVTNPTGGGVVLDHDIHAATPGAIDIFLNYAKNNGVKIVRLDEVEEFRVLRNCQLVSSFQ